MPRDGSGVFHRLNPDYVANSTASSAAVNGDLDDIVQDQNGARPVTAGGTGATNAADALTNLGAFASANIDADSTLAANSDTKVASQKAVKTALDAKTVRVATTTDNAVARYDGTTGAQQNSGITISDDNKMTGVVGLTVGPSGVEIDMTTTAPGVNVKNATATSAATLVITNDATTTLEMQGFGSGFSGASRFSVGAGGQTIAAANKLSVGTIGNADLSFYVNSAYAGKFLGSNGWFLVGATAFPFSTVEAGVLIAPDGGIVSKRANTTLNNHITIGNNAAVTPTQVGSISSTGSATSFNTSSDETMKDFIGAYDPQQAIAVIKADPVREFTWKSDGSHAVGWGAQTSYSVSSDLATPGGWKDPLTEADWQEGGVRWFDPVTGADWQEGGVRWLDPQTGADWVENGERWLSPLTGETVDSGAAFYLLPLGADIVTEAEQDDNGGFYVLGIAPSGQVRIPVQKIEPIKISAVKVEAQKVEAIYRPWGVDQAKRTPYLWATMSYLLDKLTDTEARLAALEAHQGATV